MRPIVDVRNPYEAASSLPPSGLLGLFQLKSQGAPPRPLPDARFIFDASEYYWRQLEQAFTTSQTFAATTAGAAFGTAGAAVGPAAGKGWLLTRVALQALTGAAESISLKIVVTANNGIGNFPIGPESNSLTKGVAGIGQCTCLIDRPIIMPPSSVLRLSVTQITTAATITVNGAYGFVEFPWS